MKQTEVLTLCGPDFLSTEELLSGQPCQDCQLYHVVSSHRVSGCAQGSRAKGITQHSLLETV